MAEFSPEEQRDLIENAKSRDQRLALIELSLDVQAEFRDSRTWRYLSDRVEMERADIAEQLATLSPADLPAIAHLQARAISVVSFKRWLAELIHKGAAAEEQINIEDGRIPADE